MENTKDFSWFEEEAVKAVMTNDLSFSDEYYKEIDRQVTEEMHRILDWNVPFAYSTYKVAVSFSTAKKLAEDRIINWHIAEGAGPIDDNAMNDIKAMAEKETSENFVRYAEFDGEPYGFIKMNIIIYRAQISWIGLKGRITQESFMRPMAFAGFCKE